MKGYPEEYIAWYQRRLNNRLTTLVFDNYVSAMFNIENRVDQGCPLSVIAFLIYNSDVLEVADPKPSHGELSLGFIDDIALVAKGKMFEEANKKLKYMIEKPGGALEWSRNHNAEFELDKTALICVLRRHSPDPSNHMKTIPIARPAITICQHTIQPSKSHKFLGVIVDEEL